MNARRDLKRLWALFLITGCALAFVDVPWAGQICLGIAIGIGVAEAVVINAGVLR